ncbi:TPA: hypothetical protein DCX16_05700 [bacterium]|nr:hypothetical protein [bacterium]
MRKKISLPIRWIIIFGFVYILAFLFYRTLPSSIWKIFIFIFLLATLSLCLGSLFDLRFKVKDISQKITLPTMLFFVLLYTVLYSYISILQYNIFITGHWDIAGFDQAIWNTIRGKPLHTTMYGHNFLGEHMSPTLLVLVPFYFIWQDPRMLLILQSLFLGISAIPVYLIARDKLKNNILSLSFSIAFLSNPFLSRVNLYEFHEIALSPFFLFFTFYFLQRKTWLPYFVFLFLSLLVKEDISLIIIGFGIYSFFKINKKIGIITFVIGIIWAYLSIFVLIPYIRKVTGEGLHDETYGYFGRLGLGQTAGEIFKNIAKSPQIALKMLFFPLKEKFCVILVLSLSCGLFPFLSVATLICILDTALHFLSPDAMQSMLCFHYSCAIIPFFTIGGIYGAFLFKKKFKNITIGPFFFILTASFLSNYYFSVKGLTRAPQTIKPITIYEDHFHKSIFSFPGISALKKYKQTEEKRRMFDVLKKIIPKDASISPQDNLVAHFSQREVPIYPFPNFKDTDYVILCSYSIEDWVVSWQGQELYAKGVAEIFSDPDFKVFFRDEPDGGLVMLARKKEEDKIIKNAEEFAKSFPNLSDAHFILGTIYFYTGNFHGAIDCFNTALKITPRNRYAQRMLDETKRLINP